MKTKEFLGKKKTNSLLLNRRGQFLIESVLLLVILLGLFMAVTNYAREKKLLSKLVEGPIKNVAAMTAFGTWKPDGCKSASGATLTIGKCHPNSISRSLSSSPDAL